MSEFNNGDRVRVRLEAAERYIQPWRGRFEKGRVGTVISNDPPGTTWSKAMLVEFDHARTKMTHFHQWRLYVDMRDLEHAPAAEGKANG